MPVGDGTAVSRRRRLLERRLPLFGEMCFLGLVIAVWEALRIPIEGTPELSVAHARDWLALERALHLDIEAAVIQWTHDADLVGIARFGYYNFHLPVLFGFMAFVRLMRPERYPFLRTAFVLSHVPALTVIALYPLMPPRWVPGLPYAVEAPEGLNGAMHNATAAAASQHVGYPIFIAISTVWLARRTPVSWLAWLYPAVVFMLVVMTANHYTLDAIIGGLCALTGFAGARLLFGPLGALRREPAPPLAVAVTAAVGYGCIVKAIDSVSALSLPPNPVNGMDLLLLSGIALVVTSLWWSRREPPGPAWERAAEAQAQDARSSA